MIGGNITAKLQKKMPGQKNNIGGRTSEWKTVADIPGWLDLSGGESHYTNFNAKIQESTHIFICDYQSVDIPSEEARMVINGSVYDVLIIDNPMGMNRQLEFYLKYRGGQNVS